MKKPPKGIFFDLDDTIVSLDASADRLWKEVCVEFGPKIKGAHHDSLLLAIEKTRKWFWQDAERHARGRHNLAKTRREIVRIAFSESGLSCCDHANDLADAFTERRTEKLELFPHAERTLETLSRSGVKLGLITNGHGDGQRKKVVKLKLERFFECILIEGEVGIAKPDPAIFQMALDRLGLSASGTWRVGDNLEWDVSAAQSMGILGIWNDFKREGLPSDTSIRPDRIINEIGELIERSEYHSWTISNTK